MSDLVREFLWRSLSVAGGVVEGAPEGLEALLPATEASRLGLPEHVRIHLAAEPPTATGAVDGRLGSALLERLVAARLERAPIAAVALPAELPRALPEGLPVLLNAVRAAAAESRRVPARFLAADLRVTLQGEELRSVLLPLTIRLQDGARVGAFGLGAGYPVASSPLDEGERRRAADALRGWLLREGPTVLAGALETLKRRARRDLERMAEYYTSLDADMARAAERARSEEERARRLAKRAALPADLAARREQLRTRMRPRLSARIVAATLVETEIERFTIPVRRRSHGGTVVISCRAADGVFEGPGCTGCGLATLRFYLCDDRLHALCESCGRSGRLDRTRCGGCQPGWPEPAAVSVEDATARLRIAGSRLVKP
jgi:hypothetical protein